MSEIENNTSLAEDDEISLIDLFSVVIRHRMMIIIGSIAVFVLAAVYLFVIPLVFPKTMKREITVQYSVNVTPIPRAVAGGLPAKFSSFKTVVVTEFTDQIFLVKELKKNNPFVTADAKEMDSLEFNRFVQDKIIKEKKYSVAAAGIRDEVIITLKIPEDNLDVATKFVDSMIASVNNSAEAAFLNEVYKLKNMSQETYNEIQKVFTENSNLSEAQGLMVTVRQVDEFLKTYERIAEREIEPFVVLEPMGRIKKLVIATFAAFFIFVFIAFLKNAIENIKNDPEASGKIKAAWDNGKLGRK